jgi:hypothetical protein
MRLICVALHVSFGILVCVAMMACGGGGANGGGVLAPTVTLTAAPTTPIALGQSVTLKWSSTNATQCTASASPAENDWSGAKATSGSQTATPTATGTETYSLSCSGVGGTVSLSVSVTVNSNGAMPVITGIVPQTIYLDSEGAVDGLEINGSGFAPGCVLHDSLFGDSTLAAGTSANQIVVNLSFDTPHYSPGWVTFSVSCASGTSNSANLAFEGNQNTLAISATGELYQLDQAQGAPTGQNGFVRVFDANGSANTSFLVGALANGIAFDDLTGQVLVSYPGGSVAIYDPATGTAVNSAGVTPGPVMGVAAKNGLGCATQPAQNFLSCFVVSLALFNPPIAAVAAGTQPWTSAMLTLGSETDALVYSRESTEIRRYSVLDLDDKTQITLQGALTVSGITRASQLQGANGGWQIVAFGSGLASRTAAFLSQTDGILVFVDLNTMMELRRVTLQGIPLRIAPDATHGTVIVAFADVNAGLMRFAKVDVATATLTSLNATSSLLAVGLAVSADGTSILAAMRDQLAVLTNQ